MTDPRVRLLTGSEESRHLLLAKLDSATLRIELGDSSPGRQALLITLVDLLARLLPLLDVVVPPSLEVAECLPPGPTNLAERLQAVRANGGLPVGPGGDAIFRIAIGNAESGADLYVDGDEWQSYIGSQPSRLRITSSPVPFGALTAACRAAAHAITAVLAPLVYRAAIPQSTYSSLLTYRTSADPFDDAPAPPLSTNRSLLVGAGSIGGAVAYAWSFLPTLSGELDVVDPEVLEARNVAKGILARATAAAAGKPKVDVVKEELAHLAGLTVRTHQLSANDYHATLSRAEPLPPVLCAVDSIASRRELQDCLPLEVLNAACHPRDVTISRHVTDDGPCLYCIHIGQVLDSSRIQVRLVSQATGLTLTDTIVQLNDRPRLDWPILAKIAQHRGLSAGSLARYQGRSLEELWHEQLLYAESPMPVDGSDVTVGAPFVTALAGFLLAAEALKSCAPGRLGPHGVATKYEESPYTSPEFALLTNPERWRTSECLCRSTRRLRLFRSRYGLPGLTAAS